MIVVLKPSGNKPEHPHTLELEAVRFTSREAAERWVKHMAMEMNALWPKEKKAK